MGEAVHWRCRARVKAAKRWHAGCAGESCPKRQCRGMATRQLLHAELPAPNSQSSSSSSRSHRMAIFLAASRPLACTHSMNCLFSASTYERNFSTCGQRGQTVRHTGVDRGGCRAGRGTQVQYCAHRTASIRYAHSSGSGGDGWGRHSSDPAAAGTTLPGAPCPCAPPWLLRDLPDVFN